MSGTFRTWSALTKWGRRWYWQCVSRRGGKVMFAPPAGFASKWARDRSLAAARNCHDAPVVAL